jgi:hypothetical protein
VRNNGARLFFPIFLSLFGAITLMGQTKVINPAQRVRPPISRQPCPDIAVISFAATLVSTQVGDSSVDFPHDTVRLDATLGNEGTLAVPRNASLHIELSKNGEVIYKADKIELLGAPGSRWTLHQTDSFPHNLKTTYTITVTTSLTECRKDNNQASFTIDETKLHPTGTPDLTCSIFKVEKRWQQQGAGFKGTCTFSAQVANVGNGYCRNNSQPLQLGFYQSGGRLLASVQIPESDLPAPGTHKVFSVEVADTAVPYGDITVSASIAPAANEQNRNNNSSTNTGSLHNVAEAPVTSMARLSFPAWGMLGRILNIRVDIQDLQYQRLDNLRLILLKNGQLAREWKPLGIPSGAKIQKTMTEDRPEREGTANDVYKAILTTDGSSSLTPPAGTVLDAQTRTFGWSDMAESLLQELLRSPETGLGAKIKASDGSLHISDDKTRVQIKPESLLVTVQGYKRLKGGAHADFTASVWLKVHVRNGQVAADVIDKKINIDSIWIEFLANLLLPGIGHAIVNSIADRFASSVPSNFNFGVGGTPCGIVLNDGFLYIYY